ncbi:MAG: glutamate racemase [Proteobacteria bacterium]|nr:glutamate racemase [Pseudomonadota bacterium]
MIGIFDSGIGGLTTVRALMDVLPGHDLIYFGDTARTPYGSKSRETVIRYAIENTEFLLEHGAKVIVMACNTASSVATEVLMEKYHVPVFEVITPAVERAVNQSPRAQIGVIGTRGTINSGIYERLIKEKIPTANVFSSPCPLLVPLVEEGWFDRPETRMIVKKYLHPLKIRQVDSLILGCTHYPLLKDIIQKKIGKNVKVIDSSVAVAEKISRFFADHPDMDQLIEKNGKADLFVSDITEQFEKTASTILKKKVFLNRV